MSKHSLTIKISAIIVSVILTVIVTVTGIFAAYTNSRHAQRTIAAYDTTGYRFSSNVLGEGYAKDNIKTMYTTDALRDPSTVVTISNYERGKQTRPNESNISYTLTARLVKYDAEQEARYVPVDAAYITANDLSDYSVTITKGSDTVTLDGSNLSSTTDFGGTLVGGASNSDAYTVTFSAEFATEKPNLYLEMTATPVSNVLPTLRGIIKADMRLAGATNAWTGAFHDDTTYAPAAYDGFNYLISGVGSGTCTLSWDSTKVALSYVSIRDLLSITGATQSGDSVTFPVDSNEVGRYEVQFYKVNVGSETWSDMNTSVVTLAFHA